MAAPLIVGPYNLTEQERLEPVKRLCAKALRVYVIFVVVINAVAVGVAPDPDSLVMPALGKAALYIAVAAAALGVLVWLSKRDYRREIARYRSVCLLLSEAGCRFTNEAEEAQWTWADFKKVRRYRSVILLSSGPRQQIVIPFHACGGEAAAVELVKWLQERIESYRGRPS